MLLQLQSVFYAGSTRTGLAIPRVGCDQVWWAALGPRVPRRALSQARWGQGINMLGENAKSGALEDAKRSFVTSVSALQSWAESAGIAGELKGL